MLPKSFRVLLSFVTAIATIETAHAGQTPEQLVDSLEARSAALVTLHVLARTTQQRLWPPGTTETSLELWQQRQDRTCRNRVELDKAWVSKDGTRTLVESRLEVDQGDIRWIDRTNASGRRILEELPTCTNPFYTEIRERFIVEEATIAPSEELDGTRCAVVRFEHRLYGIMTTYWIAEETGIVLRKKTITGSGADEEMHLALLDTHAPLDEELFLYSAPDDVPRNDVAAITAMLDRMTRTRGTFDSIYFETSTVREGGYPSPDRRSREWIVQDGEKQKYRRETRLVPPEDQAGRSRRG